MISVSDLNLSGPGMRIRSLFGERCAVTGLRHVSGGDINDAYALELSDGNRLFLKCNTGRDKAFFEAEKRGLEAIGQTGAIGVPKVLDTGRIGNSAYLLMEYIPDGNRNQGYWERFGQSLAAMHSHDPAALVPGGRFGFASDNYIGAREQINTPHDTWISFYRDRRLRPQFEAAGRYFDTGIKKRIAVLLERLDDLLTEPEAPALLHGDLWGGNYITGSDGWAWLIDPAVYVGHPEADIAMTQLFGGFDRRFYDAYRESGCLDNGYADRRRLYDLYQMLNHLNMFGTGYLGSVLSIIDHYV